MSNIDNEIRQELWHGEWCGECFYEGGLTRCTCGDSDFNEMNGLDNEIQAIYTEIYALDTIEKQQRALYSWQRFLQENCSSERPCVECRRQLEGP